MAKESIKARARKRVALVARYAEKRKALKAAGDYAGLDKLPRDMIDGRPRGYMRKFGISRVRFREMALAGKIPGVTKSSW
jgi:small subunit ribosomal protein S14